MLEAKVTGKEWVVGLELLGCSLDALHADLVDGLVACFGSLAVRFAWLLKLNEDILAITIITEIQLKYSMSSRTTSSKEINYIAVS